MASDLPTPPEPAPGPPSAASTVRRSASRARYDAAAVHAVLDAGWVAHVALAPEGEPVVIPMVYARDGERLLLHGSVASRLMRGLDAGLPVSVAVTHVDGLVLARSAFHHSVNYRSVVVRGVARRVTDPDAVAAGFTRLVDHAAPGRSDAVRGADPTETRQTLLVEVPLDDVAVKVRTGGPIDEERDLSWPVWAGVVPLSLVAGDPVAADDMAVTDVAPPEAVTLP
ncbi:pyridoxamine 5'-phosphate oxidase family protein [Iamia majanohamensis]|uniref:Pyridoxamine 5'-phosphate oxidase family protein n=1 Tax=Iamia majanohamensis TaxID=467976 RepID=A0AAE9Y3K7_9ACTN|nr:pyridoxamine 5'-phosphate oxidase family protein [Iamia majanohamensis]WCO65404.1 pyridoxamine 5'-phosphate oxidase family protein [Iamia majanohamensis]